MIAAQNVAISLLVLQFEGRTVLAAGFLGALVAAGWALFNGQVVDMGMLGYAQMGAGLLGVASKAPQIWTIWKEGGTGQLSAFAVSELSGVVQMTWEKGVGCGSGTDYFSLGFQLPRGIFDEDLYNHSGGGRSVDSCWVCWRLCAQCRASISDGTFFSFLPGHDLSQMGPEHPLTLYRCITGRVPQRHRTPQKQERSRNESPWDRAPVPRLERRQQPVAEAS